MAALLVVGAASALSWYKRVTTNIQSDEIAEVTAEVEGEPYYVLLLGGDSREGEESDVEGNRTDSIMVARVDEVNKNVQILSVPRDLRVYIDNEGWYKINAAYEFGELQGTMTAVEELMDIKISYYAFIYFSGFEQLVDKLGGVTVEVPEGTAYAGVYVPAGDAVRINGEEALTLARCRHGEPPDQGAYASGDYQRALNQRNLIKAIAKEILSKNVTEYPSLIEGLSECVETNMSVTKLINLATTMKGFDTESIDAAQLPVASSIINSDYCAILYEDVFEYLMDNFKNGRSLWEGMDNYTMWCNYENIGDDYIEGEHVCYTYYRTHFGEFLSSGTTEATDSSGTEEPTEEYSEDTGEDYSEGYSEE